MNDKKDVDDGDERDRDMQSVDCHYRSTDGQAEELYHLWIKMSAIMKEYKVHRLLSKFHRYGEEEKKRKN